MSKFKQRQFRQATATTTRRYKMYKAGKFLVFSSLSIIAFASMSLFGTGTRAKAADTAVVQTASQTSSDSTSGSAGSSTATGDLDSSNTTQADDSAGNTKVAETGDSDATTNNTTSNTDNKSTDAAKPTTYSAANQQNNVTDTATQKAASPVTASPATTAVQGADDTTNNSTDSAVTSASSITTANLNGANPDNVTADGSYSGNDANSVDLKDSSAITANFKGMQVTKGDDGKITTTNITSNIKDGTLTLVPATTKNAAGTLVFKNQIDTTKDFQFEAELTTAASGTNSGGGLGIILQPVDPQDAGVGADSNPGDDIGIYGQPNTTFAGRDGYVDTSHPDRADLPWNNLSIRQTDAQGVLTSANTWKDTTNTAAVANLLTEYVTLVWTPQTVNSDNTVTGDLVYTTYSDAARTQKVQSVDGNGVILNRSVSIAAFGATGGNTSLRTVTANEFQATITSVPVQINYVDVDTNVVLHDPDTTNINVGDSLTVADTTDLSTSTFAPRVINGYRFVKAVSQQSGTNTISITNNILNASTQGTNVNDITVYYTEQNTFSVQPVDVQGNAIAGLAPTTMTGVIGKTVSAPTHAGYTSDPTVTVPADNGAVVPITYTAQTAGKVTVNYVGADGIALPTAVQPQAVVLTDGKVGDVFNVPTPLIKGYVPDQAAVSATYSADDQNYTVTYTPTNNPYTITPVDENNQPIAGLRTSSGTAATGTQITLPDYSADGYEAVAGQQIISAPDQTNYNVQYKGAAITLTVHYAGLPASIQPADGTEQIEVGDQYNIVSPTIAGYTPDQAVISGLYQKDTAANRTFTVTYTPNAAQAKLVYSGLDDATAAKMPTVTVTGKVGDSYTMNAPTVTGYTADKTSVTGTYGADDADNIQVINYTGQDAKVTVNYVDADGKTLSTAVSQSGKVGGSYSITSPTVDNYTPETATVTGTFTADYLDTDNKTVTVKYDRNDGMISYTVQPVDKNGNSIQGLTTTNELGLPGAAITTPDYSQQSYVVLPGQKLQVPTTSNQTVNVEYGKQVNYRIVAVDENKKPITSIPTTETLQGIAGEAVTPGTHDGYQSVGTYVVPDADGDLQVEYEPKSFDLKIQPVNVNQQPISGLQSVDVGNVQGDSTFSDFPTFSGYVLADDSPIAIPLSDETSYTAQVVYLKTAVLSLSGEDSVTYDGQSHSPDPDQYTVSLPDGSSLALTSQDIQITSTAGATNVGTYDVTLTDAGEADVKSQLGSNYSVSFDNTKVGTFTIDQATLKPIAPNEATITYGQTTPTFTVDTQNNQLNTANLTQADFSFSDSDGKSLADVPTNAGQYRVMVNAAGQKQLQDDNPNYNLTAADAFNSSDFTINPAAATVTPTLSASQITYGDQAPTVQAIATDEAGQLNQTDLANSSFTYTNTATQQTLTDMPTNAGTYTVALSDESQKALNNDDPNYKLKFNTTTFKIQPAELAVQLKQVTSTYGDENVPTFTVDDPSGELNVADLSNADFSFINNADQSKTVLTSLPIDAGTYTVELTADGQQQLKNDNPNYTLSFTTGTYTINQATLKPIAPNEATITYGQTTPTFTVDTQNNQLNAANLTQADFSFVDSVGKSLADVPTNAGQYQVVLNAAGQKQLQDDNPNYNLTGTDAFTSGDFTIDQAAASLTITGGKTYDGTTDLTTLPTVNAPTGVTVPTLTASDFTALTSANVGSYEIDLTAAALKDIADQNPNYNISVGNKQYTITAKPVSISLSGASSVAYDGQTHLPDPDQYTVSLPDGSSMALTSQDIQITPTAGATNVGTYDVTLTDAGEADVKSQLGSNYAVSFDNKVGTFTIDQAAASLTITGNKIYDGTTDLTTLPTVNAPTGVTVPTLTASDFTALSSANVGNYEIDLTAAALKDIADQNPNYNITIGKKQYTITAKPVSISLSGTSSVTYDGQSHLPDPDQYTVSLPDGSSLTLTGQDIQITPTAGATDVGTYDVTLTDAGEADVKSQLGSNYAVSFDNKVGTFTIDQAAAALTITGSKIYDGTTDLTTLPTVNAPTGVTVPTLTASDFTALSSANVGSYEIGLTAAALKNIVDQNPNYNITIGNKQYTITAKPVSISLSGTSSVTYDGQSHLPDPDQYTVSLPDGSSLTLTGQDIQITPTAGATDVGTYNVTLTDAGEADVKSQLGSNYSVSFDNTKVGTFTIDQAKVSLSITGSKIYDSTPDLTTVPTVKAPAGVTLPTLTASDFTALTSANVGSYEIGLTASALKNIAAQNPNYNLSSTGSYTIKQATLKPIAPNEITITYSQATPTFAVDTQNNQLNTANLTQADFSFSDSDGTALAAVPTNAGQYQVMLNAAGQKQLQDDNPNYDLTAADAFTSGDFTINQAVATVTPTLSASSITYGDQVPTVKAISDKTTDLADSEFSYTDANGNTSTSIPTEAGTYTVALSADSQAKLAVDNANYKLTFDTTKLFINKATNTVSLSATTPIVYGSTPVFTANLGVKLVNSATIDQSDYDIYQDGQLVNMGAGKLLSVGDYTFSLKQSVQDSITSQNPNYAVKFGTGAFTVTSATATITPTLSSSQITFGNLAPTVQANATDEVGRLNQTDLANSSFTYTNNATHQISTKRPTDVGTYTVALSSDSQDTLRNDDLNYTLSFGTTTFTIQPANLAVQLKAVTSTYGDGKVPTFTVDDPSDQLNIANLSNADFSFINNADQSNTVLTSLPTNAGTYTVELTAAGQKQLQNDNPNYALSFSNGTYTINQATLKPIAPSEATITYEQAAPTFTVDTQSNQLNIANLTQADFSFSDANGTVLSAVPTNAGQYQVMLNAAGQKQLQNDNPNYNLTGADAFTSSDFTINKADASLTITGSKIYDGTPDLTTLPTVTAPAGVTLSSLTASDFTALSSANVGKYEIGLTAAALKNIADQNPNYNITNGNEQYTITAKPVLVSLSGASSVTYDGQTHLPDPDQYTVSLPDGSLQALTSQDIQIIPTAGVTNVGTYDVTLTDAGEADVKSQLGSNYSVSLDNTKVGTFTIAQAKVSLTITGSKTYDGTTDLTTLPTVTEPAGVTLPTLTASDFTALTSANVGKYEIGLTAAALKTIAQQNPNYNLSSTGSYLINQATLKSIAPNEATITFGQATPTFTVDTQNNQLNISNLTQADFSFSDLNGQSLVDVPTNAGQYKVMLNVAGQKQLRDANPNYDLTAADAFTSGDFTINQAVATITPTLSESQITFDDQAPTVKAISDKSTDLTDSEFSYTDANGNTSTEVPTNAGTYTVDLSADSQAKLIADNPNYTLIFGTATLTINPADAKVTPTLSESQITYGAQAPTVKASSDKSTDLADSEFSYTDANGNTSTEMPTNAGTYTVALSADSQAKLTADNTNYKLAFGTTKLVIDKAINTVSLSATKPVVYGSTPTFTANLGANLVSAATIDQSDFDIYQNGQLDNVSDGKLLDVGDYTFNLKPSVQDAITSQNPNYAIKFGTGAFTVASATAMIAPVLSSSQITFGDQAPTIQATATDEAGQLNQTDLANSSFIYTNTATQQTFTDMPTNAGTYTVALSDESQKALNNDEPNYKLKFNTTTFTIQPADLTVQLNPATSTYGDGKVPTFTVENSSGQLNVANLSNADFNFINNVDQSKTVLTSLPTNAGTYTVELTAAGQKQLKNDNPNYTLSFNTGTYTINQATLEPVAPDKVAITYGQATPKFTVTNQGNKLDTSKLTQADFSITDQAGNVLTTVPVNVGQYKVELNEAGQQQLKNDNPNYNLTGTDAFTTSAFTITQAAAPSVKLNNAQIVYGDQTPNFTAQNDSDLDLSGLTNSDFEFEDNQHQALTGIPTNAGSYTITLNAAGWQQLAQANPNYQFTAQALSDGTFTLTPFEVPTVTVASQQIIFGTTPTYMVDYDQVGGGVQEVALDPEDVTLTPFTDNDHPENENYTVSLNAKGKAKLAARDANDAFSQTVFKDGTLTIQPLPASGVKAADQTVTYGKDTVLQAGYGQGLTSASLSNDDFAIFDSNGNQMTQPISQLDVGEYTVRLNSAGKAAVQSANPHDSFSSFGDGTLTVVPATAPEVTASNFTINYGSQETLPVFTVSSKQDLNLNGLSSADFDINGQPSTNGETLPVGNYTITLNQDGQEAIQQANPNYDFEPGDFLSGTLSVKKASATTVTPATQTISYGETPTLAVTYGNGIVDPQLNASDFTFTDSQGKVTDGIVPQNAGTYAVTINANGQAKVQQQNPNYEFDASDFMTGQLVIEPAKVTGQAVAIEPGSKTYDGAPITAVQVSLSKQFLSPTWQMGDFTNTTDPNKGSYTVSLSQQGLARLQAANPNYVLTLANVTPATYKILPATLAAGSIKVGDSGKVYDGSNMVTALPTVTTATGITLPTFIASDFTALPSVNVGTYAVGLNDKAIKAVADLNPNYVITGDSIATGQYNVSPATVTISANNVSKVSGQAEPKLTAVVTGLIDNDQLDYQLVRTGTDEPGTCLITVNVTPNPNYLVIVVDGQFTITPAPADSGQPGVTPNNSNSAGQTATTPGTPTGSGQQTTPTTTVNPGGPNMPEPTKKPGNGQQPKAPSQLSSKPEAQRKQAGIIPVRNHRSSSETNAQQSAENARSTHLKTAGTSQPLAQRQTNKATHELPQTGETSQGWLAVLGASLLGLLGLSARRKRQH
ncbi:MBG domain-containing protein [Secundilactobacillus folii]|uniref:LPXTG cell wall anchor domain-containing protein n=1 Tax=Secundilactobacillus folii TaxID=2678357 RepID=A0A7X2XWD3_9LACO|nr:MBG domain-containing protein [Secundilactobacillus folii]MTV82745.1 LPXTG cell wall anchor domain-containing protein [Secundilactobacillus folii]